MERYLFNGVLGAVPVAFDELSLAIEVVLYTGWGGGYMWAEEDRPGLRCWLNWVDFRMGWLYIILDGRVSFASCDSPGRIGRRKYFKGCVICLLVNHN
jgi:hypothetical protein